MPINNDLICTICGERRGAHHMVDLKCPIKDAGAGQYHTDISFIAEGNLIIGNCKPGWVIQIAGYTTTLLVIHNGTYLLGWKKGEVPPFGSTWDRASANYTGTDPLSVLVRGAMGTEYQKAYWVLGNYPVEKVISMSSITATSVSAVVSSGMNCANRYCNERNEYAVANQTNGTYLCYACAQGGHTMSPT